MSVRVLVDVACPECGVVNQRREIIAEVAPDCLVTPSEVIWCRACRTELNP